MKGLHKPISSYAPALLAFALLPTLALAHPGHGLGPVGHDLQHALWNFMGIVVLATVVLLVAKLPALSRHKRKREDNDRTR